MPNSRFISRVALLTWCLLQQQRAQCTTWHPTERALSLSTDTQTHCLNLLLSLPKRTHTHTHTHTGSLIHTHTQTDSFPRAHTHAREQHVLIGCLLPGGYCLVSYPSNNRMLTSDCSLSFLSGWTLTPLTPHPITRYWHSRADRNKHIAKQRHQKATISHSRSDYYVKQSCVSENKSMLI